ncbi:radical SAM protein [Spirulina sp. CS-785/01]|uniref:radical SAM protein n=1 Tax=Spirulina sp. CS-785/01 TaxID=3021716 RepID=UPI00232D2351|nr:radical SAM protein [Spirulina sp. CS-785/01]MDB9315378.1 radical SAM protein [Spirulina sp. CS-785/01]
MTTQQFNAVYGPVTSWRYGRSLGLDPIGKVSTCSFNCVYCQLGAIEHHTAQRDIYVPTEKIISDLQHFAPWDVDVITLSGSGEPTLAANLGEILDQVKALTQRPTLVLTNATLFNDPQVRQALLKADKISAKLDTVTPRGLKGINRPVMGITYDTLTRGLLQLRQEYSGELGIQTMILRPWPDHEIDEYLRFIQRLSPDVIHLNTPTRPKPRQRQFDGRGNHSDADNRAYSVQHLTCVEPDVLSKIAQAISQQAQIPVKWVSH